MKVVGDYAWEMYQQNQSNAGELLTKFLTHPPPADAFV